MGYTYLGDSTLGVSLTISTPKPLDSRSVVSDISSLYSISAENAYEGMSVVVLSECKTYILKDKSKITTEDGWKTSDSDVSVEVPIIACTQSEYDEWRENTSDDYTPIDESKKYLSENIYYYIFEESIENKDLYYLSAAWGKDIEDRISKKADGESITNILARITSNEENLANNYTTTEELTLLLTQINTSIEGNATEIESIKLNYYDKTEADGLFLTLTNASDIYVTKEDLRGSETSEEDDFIFVTQTQYNTDKEAQALSITTENLTTTTLSSTSVTTDVINLTNADSSSEIAITEDKLTVNGELVAFFEEIPKMVCITLTEYDLLVEESNVAEDTYYLTYSEDGNPTNTYITSEYASKNYYTRNEVLQEISNAINELNTNVIAPLQLQILDLEARITALEPTDEETPEETTEEL